jgi:hypothetical protein
MRNAVLDVVRRSVKMPLAEYQQTTLQECMQQQGCPLCRAVWKMDAARFGWYVNDGGT